MVYYVPWELCVLYKLYKYDLYRATTCFCPRSCLDVGEKWILKSLTVPMFILEGGYHLSKWSRDEVDCRGSSVFKRFDQRFVGTVLRGLSVNYNYDVDGVCVIYMEHIYRLRSLILGGAPSFKGGPDSRNTNSMWLFSCNAQASCKTSCYLCETYTSYAPYCDKSINLLLQQVQLRIGLWLPSTEP